MSSSPEFEKLGGAEFKWGKKRGIGGKKKEVQFYESFTYDGVDYALYDCVYMYKENEPAPYIGKLVKIWEYGDKAKRIKVHWFFRPSEISNYLKDLEVSENELFFASGEGKGLANINSLEPIAGKCNVVCISKDNRNPQPSAEEIQMADYVFSRIFDVKSLTVSDKMDDKVGGLEVKYVFNRREDVLALASNDIDEEKNVVAYKEAPKLAGKNSTQQLNNMKEGKNQMSEEVKNKTSRDYQNQIPSNSISPREILESAHEDSDCAEKDNKLGDLNAFRNMPSISNVDPCGETPRPSTINTLPNGTSKSSTDKDFEGSRQAAMKKSLEKNDDLTKEKLVVEHEKSYEVKYKKRASSSCHKEEGSLKKAKYDDAIKRKEDSKDDTIQKSTEKNCVGETKNSPKLATPYDDKPKSKLGEVALKANHYKEKGDKLSSDNLLDPLISRSKGGEKVGVQVIEVTRRPNEKSKWIKLTWEEKMKTAHDEEKLVLLQNLDPEYTSGEVEDIMWHAFQEKCTAKMVQQTAISNPHCGQALVVFGSRDAANRVLQKLEDGCLMLPNQRPLVGCVGVLPMFSGKQTPFVGHLSIDKARHQMQREKKEAVATSHYSQNNTIEYEMAMDWCLLQSRSDKWWKMLHQQQRKELAKHTQSLKRKRTPIEQSN